MVKRCLFCGRFFNPDPRVKNQKSCFREQCKKARKQLAQTNWCKNNLGYFKDRYPNLKEWREKNKKTGKQKQEIQTKFHSKDSVYKLVLLIPKISMNKVQLQECLLLRKVGRSTFFASLDRKITPEYNDTRRDTSLNISNDAGLQMMDTFKSGMIQDEISL